MAIAVDVQNLGGAIIDSYATSIPFTTGANVAAGADIFCFVTVGNSVTLSSVTGGGLSYSIDQSGVATYFNIYLVRLPAPSGLASGSTLTANFSGSFGGRSISGWSLTGVGALSGDPATQSYSGTANWTTVSAAVPTDGVLLGGAVNQDSSTTSTPSTTTPETFEHSDRQVAGFSVTACSRVPTASPATVSGTWSGSTSGAVIAAAYEPYVVIPWPPEGSEDAPERLRVVRSGQRFA